MKVGVIMGGISSEREVSLRTGEEIASNLDKNKYQVSMLVIDKKEDLVEKVKDIDFAFIALHGKFGEDGTVQGVLQTLGIPYSGSDVACSALCMDKDMTKKILRYSGINTADWVMVKDTKDVDKPAIERLGFPLVVKPNCGGSSVATNVVESFDKLEAAIIEALKYDSEVMLEQYIKGEEITCCILDGKLLPVIAIKPTSSFFDYTSKYSDGGAEEVIINLEPKLHETVEKMALQCWKGLKCKVYSRVDMFIKQGVPYVLELNTLPGMTKNSLFPKSAAAVGMSFSQLLDCIIQYSLKEKSI